MAALTVFGAGSWLESLLIDCILVISLICIIAGLSLSHISHSCESGQLKRAVSFIEAYIPYYHRL